MTDCGTISADYAGQLGGFSLDVAFDMPMRGITGLFGPSGCGKTTILRGMAGLHRLAGRLAVGKSVWQDDASGVFLPPHRRPIGYVFQEASLFPHLSVRGNLQYGLRRAGRNGVLTFDDVVDLLALARLLDRAPLALSGGERQRVAVGRALLSQPRLLLMDEPLSALDRMTKAEILPYFEALHSSLALPIIYVSHDIGELERLADTLVLLDHGRVIASGPLHELQADPALPLLGMPEASVILEGRIADVDANYALTTLTVAGGNLIVPGRQGETGGVRRLRISASDVSFALEQPVGTTILNCLPARIETITPHGMEDAQVNVIARLGEAGDGARIAARVTRKSLDALSLRTGVKVYAQIKSVALIATGGSGPRAGLS